MFLDIEKAYDSMWKEGLLIKLHDAGVKGRIFYWIKDFLNNGSIQVKIGGDLSETVNIINGTPQESVISPVLFSIMINDIFSRVPNHFGKSLFTDDWAIWKRGRNLHVIFHQMQRLWIRIFSGLMWSLEGLIRV